MNDSISNTFLFPEVRVVEASAGSGKTYALAKRYVQLLINPHLKRDEIPLRAILAITFTNKATIEMKERILEFLKKIAFDRFSGAAEREDLLSSLGVPPEAAAQKAFYVMDHIIRNYDFFQVQTIDSFVNAIVSGCAFNLNLSSRFRIKTDYSAHLAYSLDSLIERATADGAVAGLFRDFLLRYLHVENNQGWFPRENILALMQALYENRNIYGGEFKTTLTVDAGDLFAIRQKLFERFRALRDCLPEGTNKTFVKSLDKFLSEDRRSFAVDELSAYFARETFPLNKGKPVPEPVEKLWDAIRFELRTLCRYEAHTFFNCYIDIFNLVLGDFRALTRKDDLLFLSELNRQASELFAKDGITVPELYYRLATRFHHLLIDEFQDTSGLQWRNLLPMADEVLSSGGSLFYVGDKKQAIYRFRGGDATLFDTLPLYFKAYNPRLEILSRNYRSRAEVVRFNNEVFSEANLRRFIESYQEERDEDLGVADISGILKVFADSRQSWREENEGGRVVITPLECKTIEERDRLLRGKLIGCIQTLKERFAYGDITVLARDNRDVELLTGWLLEADIPVESEKTLNVRENALVKELVSLITFLNSPIDDLSFASFISGAILERSAGFADGEIRRFLFTTHRSRTGGYLYRAFREAYRPLWDRYFEEFFVNVGFVPLYELAVSIYEKFSLMERFPGHQAFLMRLLEIIKKHEEENTGIASFLEYFRQAESNDLYVTVTDTDSVRLLTIHKSKGLEFPVVIIPFLEMDLGMGKKGTAQFDIQQDGGGLSLVRLNKAYGRYSEELAKLYLRKYRKAFVDELNAVYVALTRAKYELYAWVPQKTSSGANPMRFMIPEPVERGEVRRYEKGSPRDRRQLLDIPVAEYRDWLEFVKYEFAGDSALVNRENRLRGEILHFGLACIGNLAQRSIPESIKTAVEKTVAAYPGKADPSWVERTLKKVVEHPALIPFFNVTDGEAFCEKEVIDAAGNVKRLDRLVVAADTVRILDFKSAADDGNAYRKQVLEYMQILKAMYPGKKLTGHLFYFDSLRLEEVIDETELF